MKSSVALNERERDGACEGARARARYSYLFPALQGSVLGICVIICEGPINTTAMQHSLAEAGVALTAAVSVINNYVEY